MASRLALLACVVALLLVLASAQHTSRGHSVHATRQAHGGTHGGTHGGSAGQGDHAEHSGMDTSSSQLADEPPAPAPPSPPVAVEEEKPGFHGMYFGILITFVIFWAIYLFLYFFEYETAGDYFFYMSSYVTLFVLISLGLSEYFTASVLTGLLVSVLFIMIAGSGFGVMGTITSPDRFEGDKHNMGRTRLE